MNLQLTAAEAQLISAQLQTRIEHLEHELVHTDDRKLHAALKTDIERLRVVTQKVTRLTESAPIAAAAK
jgi:hypothetical protein